MGVASGRNVDLEHGAVERLVDVDLRQPNRQVGHRRRLSIALGNRAREDGSWPAAPTKSRRTARRPVPLVAAVSRHAPSTCWSQLVASPASTATQPAIERTRPRVASPDAKPHPATIVRRVLGTDRHAGQRLERRRRRRVTEHARLSRQDERRLVANRHIGEERLARRGKLEPDAALALRSPRRSSRGTARSRRGPRSRGRRPACGCRGSARSPARRRARNRERRVPAPTAA